MSQSVIEKARELAGIIAQSPEYITLRATEDAATQDEALTAYFARYHEIHRQIEEETLKKEPNFEKIGDLSRELDEAQEQLKQQPMYQALQGARRTFTAMMNQVNAELSSVLNPNGAAAGGCSGNCAGCSGCG
ncbi:MAG: YlbF family regulator [Clostridia bacterium]|nr:YlbF family regulator [Clostridia bacterium]